jgi:hypothetical protein
MDNVKIAIITANIGERCGGVLMEQSKKFDGVDYHAFVDEKKQESMWTQHNSLNFTNDKLFKDRRNAKVYKILPFLFLPTYDYYIWIDSTHDIIKHPLDIITMINGDVSVFKHSERNCIYDESNAVKFLKYDYLDLIDNQMGNYFKDGYPPKNGLYELPCFVIKNSDTSKKLCLMWWEQICKYTSRDQLSFPYVLWKLGITPQILEGIAGKNDFFVKTKPTTFSTRLK